jgi:hypothetical protein
MKPAAYRKKIEKEIQAAAKAMKKQAAGFRKKSASAAQRTRALQAVGQLQEPRDLALAMRVATNPKERERLRVAAVAQLAPLLERDAKALDRVIDLLADPKEAVSVRAAALTMLKAAAFYVGSFASRRPKYIAALRSAATSADPMLRQRALGVLARERDAPTLDKLERGLRDPAKAVVPPEKALQLLSYDPKRDVHDVLVKTIQNPPTPEAKQQALRNLAAQGKSKRILERVLGDKSEPPKNRIVAMAGVQNLAPDAFSDIAGDIVADSSENESVRAAGLVAATTFGGETAPSEKLRKGAAHLQKRARQPSARRAATRYLAKSTK